MNECDHVWEHLETIKYTEAGGYNIQYVRIDTFYCKKCLEYKNIKKDEYARESPEWYRTPV